jgi:hypothetical protein
MCRAGSSRDHSVLNRLVAHVAHQVFDRIRFHDFAALFVNDLSLVVHHVVEFQKVLTNFEMHAFNFGLRALKHF